VWWSTIELGSEARGHLLVLWLCFDFGKGRKLPELPKELVIVLSRCTIEGA
jgi:hypothetical protein